jgi:hypothetical protein
VPGQFAGNFNRHTLLQRLPHKRVAHPVKVGLLKTARILPGL